jgi:ferredoxin-NADP reductase
MIVFYVISLILIVATAALIIWGISEWFLLQKAKKQNTLLFRIIERNYIGSNLVELVLRNDKFFHKLPQHKPGQYLTLQIPIQGKIVQRCYSIASYKNKAHTYSLLIKKEHEGLCSNFIYNYFKPNLKINAKLPSGHFYYKPTQKRNIVLIAGGVGITPMRSIWEYFIDNRIFGKEVHLFYAVKSMDEFYRLQDFMQESLEWPHLFFHPFLSSDEKTQQVNKGRITMDSINQRIACNLDAEYYLCASKTMMQDLVQQIKSFGVDSTNIHFEEFGIAHVTGNTSCSVQIGNQQIHYNGGGTLLKTLEDSNIPIMAACRTGNCGLCKSKLKKGEIKYLAQPECTLCEDEILPCCCYPAQDIELELVS